VRIRNISKDLGALLIVKKNYTHDKVSLELDRYDNFISLIKDNG